MKATKRRTALIILSILIVLLGMCCIMHFLYWKRDGESSCNESYISGNSGTLNGEEIRQVIREEIENYRETRNEEIIDYSARQSLDLLKEKVLEYMEETDTMLASKAEMTDLTEMFRFKGSCLMSELPTVDMLINDTWYVTDMKCNYSWNGSSWYQSSMKAENEFIDVVKEIANNEIKKFSVTDFEKGSIADGYNSTSATYARSRIRSKDVVSVPFDIVVIPNGTKMLISYYDDEKETSYTNNSGWLSEPTVIKAQQCFRLLFAYETSYKDDVVLEELLGQFTYATRLAYDVNMTTKSYGALDLIPEYYFKDGYLDEKIEDIMRKGYASLDSISFGFITDVHMDKNAGHSMKLLKYISDCTPFVPFVVFGGDVCGEYADSTEDIMQWGNRWYEMMTDYGKEKVFQIRGNHDYNANGVSDHGVYLTATNSMIYHYVMGNLSYEVTVPIGKMYYYIDIPSKKTRLVFIDDYEGDETLSRAVKISQTQYDWLVDEALTNIEGYNILFFSHQPCDEQYKTQPYASALAPMQQILKAFKNRTNLVYDDGEISIVKDFSDNTNNFVCAVYGHTHYDSSYVDNGVLSFSTTCDKTDSRYGYERQLGTITEHAFDIVTIDFERRKIYLTRIGAGEDREFSY